MCFWVPDEAGLLIYGSGVSLLSCSLVIRLSTRTPFCAGLLSIDLYAKKEPRDFSQGS